MLDEPQMTGPAGEGRSQRPVEPEASSVGREGDKPAGEGFRGAGLPNIAGLQGWLWRGFLGVWQPFLLTQVGPAVPGMVPIWAPPAPGRLGPAARRTVSQPGPLRPVPQPEAIWKYVLGTVFGGPYSW